MTDTPQTAADTSASRPWSVNRSEELYQIPQWGRGYFRAGKKGRLQVRPRGDRGPSFDLHQLVRGLVERGYETPLLLRFGDILDDRIECVNGAFAQAIEDWEYRGSYRGVFPIKVNQQRHVVEEIVQFGHRFGLGLEVGSKPELLIALGTALAEDALIVCNGFKDREYLRMALLATKLGRRVLLVLDRYSELDLVLQLAAELEVRPQLGVRARLSTRGAGKWNESTGDLSKFGLSAYEILRVLESLRPRGMQDCLQLLHFHIGSQITEIQALKSALREASQIYCELVKHGAAMGYFDVGGGLGVDYDGTQTNSMSSMNYSLDEYASDVVGAIYEACERSGHAHPCIVSESGRALVAHHSVLVFEMLGHSQLPEQMPEADGSESEHQVLRSLQETWEEVETEPELASYHRALQLKEEAQQLFRLGYLDLAAKAWCEQAYWAICFRVLARLGDEEELHDDLAALRDGQPSIYYGNFSIFQSVPDSWAVEQLFPVVPIQRLDEEPELRGIIADLTCDSDGKLDRFVGEAGEQRTLPLHELGEDPYYVGFFLVGAYQEVLGDLHNLFGDTNVVHLKSGAGTRAGRGTELEVGAVVDGDTVDEILRYVQYDPELLVAGLRRSAEQALRQGKITRRDVQELLQVYKSSLQATSYLMTDPFDA
ncbi:MAG: arginine decarboxylase [Planctomycetota bacterium]|nr:MAG: arginine decarboxylase [Planctomycetota bacterium]